MEIVYNESFTANSSDLTNIVVGMKQAGCEVIFPSCYTQDAKLLFNTMKSMNYSPLIIGGGSGFLYPAFGEELGDLVDGIVSASSHNFDVQTVLNNEEIASIGEKFEEEYGYFMPEQGVSAFSAVYLIAQALEAVGTTDTEAVMNGIRALTCTSATPGGAVAFDETGANANAHAVIVQWQTGEDGVYRPYCVFPESEATAEFQMTDELETMQK